VLLPGSPPIFFSVANGDAPAVKPLFQVAAAIPQALGRQADKRQTKGMPPKAQRARVCEKQAARARIV